MGRQVLGHQQKEETGPGVLTSPPRTSPAVQWLRYHTPTAEGTGSIPARGTKNLHAKRQGQKKKKKEQALQRKGPVSHTVGGLSRNRHIGILPLCPKAG